LKFDGIEDGRLKRYCLRRVYCTLFINYQIQLRIVREFGLPDTTVEILQNSHFYHSNEVRHHQPQTNEGYKTLLIYGTPSLYLHLLGQAIFG
jgi:hypothetical protein